MNNPYAPPRAPVADAESGIDADDVHYGGFWLRVLATIIDSILVAIITVPLLLWAYGVEYYVGDSDDFFHGPVDVLVTYLLPAIATVLFWIARAATPGKMAFSLRIVDADTFGKISVAQAIGRYFSYIPSMLVLMLGFMWVGWDARKQGWHDKLARTVVVRKL